jgi:hypothetical protein
MWILFVLVISASDAAFHSIDRFMTEASCNAKKLQLEREFTEAYPGDKDWAFVCLLPKDTRQGETK